MRATFLSCAALLMACGGGEKMPAADSSAADAAMAPAPAALNLGDLAGKWSQVVMPEASDSVLLTSEITATADPNGWTNTFPGRPALPMRLTVDGDSIIAEMGPYSSVLKDAVQVTTNSVYRVVDGKLIGTTIAHYSGVATADSVRRLRMVATKAP